MRARDEAEVRAKLKATFQKQGVGANDIKIVKGRDPRVPFGAPVLHPAERHTAELQAMLGGVGLCAASGEPAPIWGIPNPDAAARRTWQRFMDESSYGLSVSSLPVFIMCDVDGYGQLGIRSEAVREQRWDGITSFVNELVNWWQSDLQGSIDRLRKMKDRSAEDTELMASMKARRKALQAFDGWTYQGYVDAHFPGAVLNPMDLDNPRLYWLGSGKLIPTANLSHYRMKVDFWRRLLSLWDGPVNKRADAVRAFLDHHHINGGRPEVFRDLVQDTITRLRTLQNTEQWGGLAAKLSEWHTTATSANNVTQHGAEFLTPAEALAFVRKLIHEAGQLATRATSVDALLNEHVSGPHAVAFVEFIRGEVLKWKRDAASNRPPPNMMEQVAAAHGWARGARLNVDPWLVDRCEQWLASVGQRISGTAAATTTATKVKATAPPPTLAERLEAALPGARQAFDEMLLIDGFTNKAGEYVGPERKGKAGIIANWDAVVEAFGVEGYPEHGGKLSVALGDYIPGLNIDKRTSRMRDDQPYRLKLKHAKAYLKSKAEQGR